MLLLRYPVSSLLPVTTIALKERGLTAKEGNGAGKEAGEANVKGSVDQARGQAIRDSVLHQGTLDHI